MPLPLSFVLSLTLNATLIVSFLFCTSVIWSKGTSSHFTFVSKHFCLDL